MRTSRLQFCVAKLIVPRAYDMYEPIHAAEVLCYHDGQFTLTGGLTESFLGLKGHAFKRQAPINRGDEAGADRTIRRMAPRPARS
jgi:hypothetical protein